MTKKLTDEESRNISELYDDMNHLLKKFKMKTGFNNQFVYMLLGGLMNEYKTPEAPKRNKISAFR